MASNATEDLEFFRQAALHMTSSLDMPKAMVATFAFLSRHFPIEGISLHQFDRELRGHKLFFLVTRDRFHHVVRFLPLSDKDLPVMSRLETMRKVLNYPNKPMRSVSEQHSRAIDDYLPYKQRAYLVSILQVDETVLGHLVFLGNAPECFTAEHERKQALLVPHFSVAMANMLRFQESLDFQARLDEQKSALEDEVRQLRGDALIGATGGLKNVMTMINQLSGSEPPVLIMGETGTGKEIIADAIQKNSPRRTAPFIKVNCGAIPETLVDSELFGYRKGAFTGAVSGRPGRFEQASGGTLFLDEVGELPPQVQVRLLRVLQNRVVERLGSNASIPVDVRIIAATNRHLETMLRNGTFREDLYYRLNVFPIRVPPLRERKEDIPALVRHFLHKAARRMQLKNLPRLKPESLERLMAYSWPGNVRELENLVERALILAPQRYLELETFLPQDPAWYVDGDDGQDHFKNMIASIVAEQVEKLLPGEPLPPNIVASPRASATDGEAPDGRPLPLDAVVSRHIRSALAWCGGKIHGPGGAGEVLEVNPNTLRKRMRKLNIPARPDRTGRSV